MLNTKNGVSAVLLIIVIALAAGFTVLLYYLKKPAPTPTPEVLGPTKEFTIIAKSYSFNPSEIKAQKGDKIRAHIVFADGFHDFVIDEFAGSRTERASAVATTTIEFIADKTGSFKYYCSVGSHRQLGMEGTLIVETN